ncbi:MAG: transcription antitermination factor NusB [Oscillospiraceae bacterium]|nr:transcription antitermination factor NusB [Oscillospiraceae bacterium]MCL2280186.1 transcription antitermination factor NusB [Oscillospiraceae bacterium]
MKRSVAREIAVKLCFALSENSSTPGEMLEQLFSDEYYASLREEDEIFDEMPDKKQRRYITELVTGIHEHSAELDGYIEKYSTGWKFGRISRTAVAIMKLSMYEIMYMPDIPNSAAINEAVELAKRYEDPQVVAFVNGVLGSFSRTEPVH